MLDEQISSIHFFFLYPHLPILGNVPTLKTIGPREKSVAATTAINFT